MEKTSVYLSADERRRLAGLATRTGRSQAAIIREAIAAYEPEPVGGRTLALAGVVDGPRESVAEIDERELLDGLGE